MKVMSVVDSELLEEREGGCGSLWEDSNEFEDDTVDITEEDKDKDDDDDDEDDEFIGSQVT